MKKILIKELFSSFKDGQKILKVLTSEQRFKLEKDWDIEHAYYSSTLEGSNIDRKEFEELAKGVE